MKILIIGHLGYVGPVLIKQLQKTKYELIGIDTGYFLNKKLKNKYDNLIKTIIKDVRTVNKNDLDDIDCVIYLSAISNDPMGNQFKKITKTINYSTSLKIAKLAKKVGVKKFIFASSCSMYGFTKNLLKSERSNLNPLTAYAKSKVRAEKDLKKISNSKFKVICLRFATACGYSDNIRLDLVLNDFVASAITSKKITVLSDGSPWRPLIHVQDMARAINWAIEAKVKNFLAVNTGSNRMNFQIKDLANRVGSLIKGTKVSINSKALPDKRSYKVNFSKFESLNKKLRPIFNLDRSIRDLHNNLLKNNFKVINFRDSNYIRLNVLKDLIKSKKLNKDLRWIS